MIKKFAIFNYVFRKSLFSLVYYRDVVKTRFRFSFKYFWSFSFFLGLLLTISLSVAVIPGVNAFLTKFSNRAHMLYPQDLVITLKNGELSTNVAEPLRFPIPFELIADNPPAVSDQKQIYLITIDTQASASAYETSRSLILLTKTDSIIADPEGGYRSDPLKNWGDVTIDKKFADGWLNKILPLLKYAQIIIVLAFGIFFVFILPVSRLVSLVFLTLFLLIPVKLLKLDLSFKKLYQIGLHALTLPTLIQIFMLSFGLLPALPFFNSILYLLYAMVILSDFKRTVVKNKINE